MVLTYKNLSDKEKLTYIKRGVVMGFCAAFLYGLVIGCFFGAASIIISWNEQFDIEKQTAQKSNTHATPELRSFVLNSAASLFFVSLMIAVIGISSLAGDLGDYICKKLNLFTKIDLEMAQSRLEKIQQALKD